MSARTVGPGVHGGYVLAHVLEVVVPGIELGDNPLCELALGESSAQCPVPSTLQSENVMLPTCGQEEPIVRVAAFDSQRHPVGLVVVPVNTLVPLEVWNVWYAMDDGGEDDEERPPEETSKMHLLLQYVSAEAAAEETQQLREMRSQDFLLRALQQLNAALEAKVLQHQTTGACYGSVESLIAQVPQPAAHPQSRSQQSSPPQADASGLPVLLGPGLGANGSVSGASAEASVEDKLIEKAQVEELLRIRVQPYERVISALEEKQRFYDDQEIRLRSLTRTLEEQQRTIQSLQAQLRESSGRRDAELNHERDCARQAQSDKSERMQQIVEFQQELDLRKAHEDSLQRRIALLENELSMVHQRCFLVDRIEEESNELRREIEGHTQARRQLQRQTQDLEQKVATLEVEATRFHEDHAKALEKSALSLLEEQRGQERLRQLLQTQQHTSHGKDVEVQLYAEKIEELNRKIVTLENEVCSQKSMYEREKTHRKELEHRLCNDELGKLHGSLNEHRSSLRSMGEEVAKARQEAMDAKENIQTLNTELATVRRQLAQERLQNVEARDSQTDLTDARAEAVSWRGRCETLQQQLRALQEDMRKASEGFELSLKERRKSEQQLSDQRDETQKEVGALRSELGGLRAKMQEHRAELERTRAELTSAKEGAGIVQELQKKLQLAQDEVREHHVSRQQIHADLEKFTTKFLEETFSQSARGAELEKALEERNNEIKLLMYRVQELSSKYVPARGDNVDQILAKWINGYRPAVPFFRLGQGLYLFGRRQVICKISNDKPVFRVGGGFIGFDKFLELYASEELEKLLSYETDSKTGEPKFNEVLRIRQAVEESGILDDLRERAEQQVLNGKPETSGAATDRSSTTPSRTHNRRVVGTSGVADRRRSQ